MSLLPSFARAVARPSRALPLLQLRAMASTGAPGHAGSLLQAALGQDAGSSSSAAPSLSSSSSTAASSSTPSRATPSAPSSSSTAAADAAPASGSSVDANLYGPTDFYASSDPTEAGALQGEAPLTPADVDFYREATVPYEARHIPATGDPLCDFWVGVVMSDGNKLKTTILLSKTLDAIARQTNSPPLPIFRAAIIAASPMCRLKSIRKGAKTMVVPIPMTERQRTRFGIQWILKAADKRAATQFEKRVAMEMLAVLDGSSNVLKMLDERHKVAMMNRSNLPKNIGA